MKITQLRAILSENKEIKKIMKQENPDNSKSSIDLIFKNNKYLLDYVKEQAKNGVSKEDIVVALNKLLITFSNNVLVAQYDKYSKK